MPQQLPQIPVLPTRHPDRWKVVLQQQTQNMLRILPIRLLFAPTLAPYRGRVSYPKFQLQLCQQSFKPACVPTGLHTDTHPLTRSRQSMVELLRTLAVHEPLLLQLSSFCINESYLLKARMVIATYNEHVGSFLRACWLA